MRPIFKSKRNVVILRDLPEGTTEDGPRTARPQGSSTPYFRLRVPKSILGMVSEATPLKREYVDPFGGYLDVPVKKHANLSEPSMRRGSLRCGPMSDSMLGRGGYCSPLRLRSRIQNRVNTAFRKISTASANVALDS